MTTQPAQEKKAREVIRKGIHDMTAACKQRYMLLAVPGARLSRVRRRRPQTQHNGVRVKGEGDDLQLLSAFACTSVSAASLPASAHTVAKRNHAQSKAKHNNKKKQKHGLQERQRTGRVFVCVIHINPFFLSVEIQHT